MVRGVTAGTGAVAVDRRVGGLGKRDEVDGGGGCGGERRRCAASDPVVGVGGPPGAGGAAARGWRAYAHGGGPS